MDTVLSTLMLRKKLFDLRQAMFFVYNESEQKTSAGLVNDYAMDENGNIWFFAKQIPVTAYEWNSYAAELTFYRKGLSYCINVSGKATIENLQTMLIKLEPFHVTYHGPDRHNILPKPGFLKTLSTIWDLFTFTPQHQFKLG